MSRMPSVGDVIDDVFRVDDELDHGNFGAVYKVTDLLEKQVLALKVLKPGPHDEEELRQRFEREARLIYSLQHPHVVRVFYYGETESELPYMAMELLQGTDLKTLLRHHGELSEALARRIAIESLSALHSAHDTDIVHRDLKPGNIYLVNDGSRGHVKVLDFGFAKALEKEDNREITNAGTLVGTPAYMSPELVHKRDVGPPADIYAMGLILAEMLTGEKVVQIEKIYDTVLFQGAEDKPIEFSDELDDSVFLPILEKSTSKHLEERYGTALEMIDDLRELELPGVGTYDEDVPLGTDLPQRTVASADVDDSSPSRTSSESNNEEHPRIVDIKDDDPTVERHYSFEATPATGASHTGSSPADRPLPEEFEAEFDKMSKPLDQPTAEYQDQSPAVEVAAGGFEGEATAVETPADARSAPSRDEARSRRAARRRRRRQTTTPIDRVDEAAASAGSAVKPNDSEQTSTEQVPSAMRDVIIGIVVGAAALAVILTWLHFS